MRCGDRACRARRDATLARSTMIRDRLVCRQFQRRQDFCEEKPCSETLIDEHGAFAVPTDAGLCGIIPFQNRPSINVTFLFTSELAKEIVDLVEFLTNHLVVIIAPRIAGDSPCSGGRGMGILPIVHRLEADATLISLKVI